MKKDVDSKKMQKLVLGLIFDAVGMLSFSVPILGEFSDLVWAPISGFLLVYMYKGQSGKIAGIFGFLEEIIPFSDFIPTFTFMWIYTYYLKGKSETTSTTDVTSRN